MGDWGPQLRRNPVPPSADLNRILALPERTLAPTAAEVAALEARLRAPPGPCNCKSFNPPRACPTRLKPIQAAALLEAPRAGGLVGCIGVGGGKSLLDLLLPMVMPECKVALLLLPASLYGKMMDLDWRYYAPHWELPNLAGAGGPARKFKMDGRPVLHVVTYTKLQHINSSGLLERIAPDFVVCDEAHNLAAAKGPRVTRFRQQLARKPARAAFLTGTPLSKSLQNFAHLSGFALGDGSPFPLNPHTVKAWNDCIGPCECDAAKGADTECYCRAPRGALARLGGEGDTETEQARDGFRRRRNATLGVVATTEASAPQSITIRCVGPEVPATIAALIDEAADGKRPDGERFREKLDAARCVRALASGMFHRWRYPAVYGEGGEKLPDGPERTRTIDTWFAWRKAFNKEIWDALRHPSPNLDSAGLLEHAARRAWQTPRYEGDLPTWPAVTFPEWARVEHRLEYEPQAVWLDDFAVRFAADWAKKNIGVVWVEFPELGERIAKAAGIPWYGGGEEAGRAIQLEDGTRSCVASIRSHRDGKDLQYAYSKCLVCNPPADAAGWQQLIARFHRPGQRADVVEVDVMLHTPALMRAFLQARERARFIRGTDGDPQRLLLADLLDFESAA